jgi:hypothetical protein
LHAKLLQFPGQLANLGLIGLFGRASFVQSRQSLVDFCPQIGIGRNLATIFHGRLVS